MLKTLLGHRQTLRGVACFVAIVLSGGPVLADQHLHESGVPEEACTLCGFFDSGHAPARGERAVQAHPSAAGGRVQIASHPVVSRPFESRLCRAPPTS